MSTYCYELLLLARIIRYECLIVVNLKSTSSQGCSLRVARRYNTMVMWLGFKIKIILSLDQYYSIIGFIDWNHLLSQLFTIFYIFFFCIPIQKRWEPISLAFAVQFLKPSKSCAYICCVCLNLVPRWKNSDNGHNNSF